MKNRTLVFGLTFLFMASSVFAISVSPSSVLLSMMPNESQTFPVAISSAEFAWTETTAGSTCVFDNNQNAVLTGPEYQGNVTVHILSDAAPGNYSCIIKARATLPDPSQSSGTSGGGGGLYIPSALQQKLLEGSYIALPKNITLYNDITPSERAVIIERNITNQPIISIINRSLTSQLPVRQPDIWLPLLIVIIALGGPVAYLVIKASNKE